MVGFMEMCDHCSEAFEEHELAACSDCGREPLCETCHDDHDCEGVVENNDGTAP